MTISEPHRLTVDRSQPLQNMIAAGKYDWVNFNITPEHFPAGRSGVTEAEAVLVHFDRSITTGEALGELERANLRPADLPELLAFGAQHPDVQREFPIVELASVWSARDDYRNVASLCGGAGGRSLLLNWLEHGWYSGSRFLAFRDS